MKERALIPLLTVSLLFAACPALPAGAADLAELCALGETAAVREALEDGEPVDAANERGMTALHHTVRAGVRAPLSAHLEIIELLVAWGADPNARDREGRTALCLALEKGGAFTDLSGLLLALGADPDLMSAGARPLCLAAERGSPRQLEALLEHGADAGLRDASGRDPLTAAFSGGGGPLTMKKTRLLIEAGADVNARCPLWGDEGVTPLMAAAAFASPDVVELLLDNGALAGLRSGTGMLAHDYAVLAGREDNAFLLR